MQENSTFKKYQLWKKFIFSQLNMNFAIFDGIKMYFRKKERKIPHLKNIHKES